MTMRSGPSSTRSSPNIASEDSGIRGTGRQLLVRASGRTAGANRQGEHAVDHSALVPVVVTGENRSHLPRAIASTGLPDSGGRWTTR